MLFVERTVRSATERAIAALEVAVSELTSTLPDHKMVPKGRDFGWELGEESVDYVDRSLACLVVHAQVRGLEGSAARLVSMRDWYQAVSGSASSVRYE